MSEFKPTAPGWYWAKSAPRRKPEIFRVLMDIGDGSLGVKLGGGIMPIDSPAIGPFEWLAPVVPLEDGPGINAIQRQCLETSLPTTTLEYCLLGLAGETGEVMTEADKGWTDEQKEEFSGELTILMLEFRESTQMFEWWKKAIRSGRESALPPLPDECKPAIVKELIDVLWYGLVGLDRCGVSASQAFEQLRAKLQARKEAGTLAATTKREGE